MVHTQNDSSVSELLGREEEKEHLPRLKQSTGYIHLSDLLFGPPLPVAVTDNGNMLFRLRRAVFTYESHTSPLRVSVGDIGGQVLRIYRATVLGRRYQCSGKRQHHG